MPSVYPMSVLSCIWCRLNRLSAVFKKNRKSCATRSFVRNYDFSFLSCSAIKSSLLFSSSTAFTYLYVYTCTNVNSTLSLFRFFITLSTRCLYATLIIHARLVDIQLFIFVLLCIKTGSLKHTTLVCFVFFTTNDGEWSSYMCILHLLSLRDSP